MSLCVVAKPDVVQTYLDQQGVLYRQCATKNGRLRSIMHTHWRCVCVRVRAYAWTDGWMDRIPGGYTHTPRFHCFVHCYRKMLCNGGVFEKYTMTRPEQTWQIYQQGGTFVYKGTKQVFAHKDRSPGTNCLSGSQPVML
jgi:hypothetical protein